jgi:tetratricopeptide (TPR) repeat protein
MTDETSASRLAREALDLWTSGNLADAETKYREALARIVPGHPAVPYVRSQLACVLAERGQGEEAKRHFELALAEEESLAEGDVNSVTVRVARYFLARHLLRLGDAQTALATIEPVIDSWNNFALRIVESEARHALGHNIEALAALQRALDFAKTDEQRNDVHERMGRIETEQRGKNAG